MKNDVFKKLPPLPEFSGYNMNDIRELGKRAIAIHNNAQECLGIFAKNVATYAELAQDVLDQLVNGEITSENDFAFRYLELVFDEITKQYVEIAFRYEEVEQNNHVDAFCRVSLASVADEYALGLHDFNRNNNNPEVIRDQAAFIFANNNPTPTLQEILDEIEKNEKERDRMKAAKRTAAQQNQPQNAGACQTPQRAPEYRENNNSQFKFVQSDKTFKDVAGLKEVKEDLMQIVDFIKRPQVYKEFGAKLPKGTILYGPPGTGKTLLARAVAGEANARFIALSSTDFTASKWGEVPKMVKELFEVARNNAPCIIFIDEIDMLGMNRGADKANGLAHRESLNSFLCAMDGFDQYEGVTVIAATNRLEDLDPAMMRPGRFDNLFAVPLPHDINEVEEVVRIYMANKHFDMEVMTRDVARKMLRHSPASIESILNEACLIAIKKNNGIIRECDINEAFLKKTINGHVRDSAEVPEDDSKLVAVHEAGHALVAVHEGIPVQSVTIMGTTTGAGGLTMMDPQAKSYLRKSDFEKKIRVSYGGRAAEQLSFGEDMVTTGASADIRKVTNLIKSASANYGFNLCDAQGHAPIVYDNITRANMEKAANKYYQEAFDILKENVVALREIARALLANGTISGETVKEIYEKNIGVPMELA